MSVVISLFAVVISLCAVVSTNRVPRPTGPETDVYDPAIVALFHDRGVTHE